MTEPSVDVHIEPGDDDAEQERLRAEAAAAEKEAASAVRQAKGEGADARRLDILERDLRAAREVLARIEERESGESKFAPKEHLHDDRYVTKEDFERARFEANEPPLDIPTEPLEPPPVQEEKEERTKVKFGL